MLRKYGIFIFIFACLLKAVSADIINTNDGPISGVPSFANDVEAYLGIPYAEPPVGELRFAKPVPKKKWTKTYDASSLPPPCTQTTIDPYYFMPDVTNMSEDCLYLNVWAPKSKPTSGLRPVIIFIHPGAFTSGSTNLKAHDGSKLASRGDVVVVTIGYRLGVFGFFLAHVEEADGNMGIFDQIMAMEWVKDNAKFFNGDPDNIVLMGSSAGSVTITGHFVSPLSKSLFKRAIISSGSAVNPLFLDDNARLDKNCQSFASLAGCSNATVSLRNSPRPVVECLKNMSEEELLETQMLLQRTNPALFIPRTNDEFLPKNAVELIREGNFEKDKDVLIGINENEGSMFLLVGAREYLGYYGKSVQKVNKFRALTLARSAILLSGQKNTSRIIDYYMNHVKNRTTTGYLRMVSNILGDYVISCSTTFFADFVSLKGNAVYFYKLAFRPASTPTPEWFGTTHLDEVQYVFGSPYHENFTAEEVELSNNIIDRWSAFARTGNPNIPGHVPWLRYSYHNPLYLNFGQEEESIRRTPNDRCELWRKRFSADIDAELIRFLRNSGMNIY